MTIHDLETQRIIRRENDLSFTLGLEDNSKLGIGEDTFLIELDYPIGVPYAPGNMSEKEYLEDGNIIIRKGGEEK